MGKIGLLALVMASTAMAKPRPKTAPVAKDARAEWKKHVKAGWAKQKAKAWGEAVTEFEAALAAVPMEQRALAELGWSAMNAGDFVKARKADEQVIAVALDPKVKASAYYNLGEVQKKTGDKAGAIRSYMASLQLRPNKIVAKAVVGVGGDPKREDSTCSDVKTTCDCAKELSTGSFDDMTCTDSRPAWALTGFKVTTLHNDDSTTKYSYLFDPQGHYVARLEADAWHGRHDESDSIESQEIKTVGGHKVLWLVVAQRDEGDYPTDMDSDTSGMEIEEIEDKLLTVCVLGDGKAPAKCPVSDLVIEHAHTIGYMADDPANEAAFDKKHEGSGEGFSMTANLAPDGTLTIKLDKGAADDSSKAWLGPHKLW